MYSPSQLFTLNIFLGVPHAHKIQVYSMHVCMYVHIRMCMHVSVYVCDVCVYMYLYVCKCMCMYACVYRCMYVYVCVAVWYSGRQGLRSLSSSPTLAFFPSDFPSASYQPHQSTQL